MSNSKNCKFTNVSLGIIGNSGLFNLVNHGKFIEVDTPYGKPSDKIEIAQVANKIIAVLPRHGSENNIVPHKINYRANIWALHHLGIKRIVSFCVAGSLRKSIRPGDFLICDDMIDQTKFRNDTFYDCGERVHVYMDHVFCPNLKKLAFQTISSKGYKCHPIGTMVVINGPRFATKAESKMYINNKCDIINMTQYPECYLARELNMCYVSVVLISDYDIGVDGVKPSSLPLEAIKKTFKTASSKLKDVMFSLVEAIPNDQSQCECKQVFEKSLSR